jgi:hypothetical protein
VQQGGVQDRKEAEITPEAVAREKRDMSDLVADA